MLSRKFRWRLGIESNEKKKKKLSLSFGIRDERWTLFFFLDKNEFKREISFLIFAEFVKISQQI